VKSHERWGFMVTDSVGCIVYANDMLCRISNRSLAELIGVESDRLLGMRRGLEIEHSPVYGRAGEYLGGFAVVRLVN
jgi:PAS domain-containing protein